MAKKSSMFPPSIASPGLASFLSGSSPNYSGIVPCTSMGSVLDPPLGHTPHGGPPLGGHHDTPNSLTTSSASGENEFENMVGDLRRTFIGWLKKTDADLRKDRETLRHERQLFEEEKTKIWKQFVAEKSREYEKIQNERRQMEMEAATALKQLQVEREDHRRKIAQEKSTFSQEIEQNRRKMLMEREKFRAEYEAFELEQRRIVDANIATETMVDLNVGGIIFETSRHTLVQQAGSYLEALLSGRHKISRDRQGRVFIDRDSELFRIILNFLRNPEAPPQPRDSAESEALCKEADHYGVRFFPFPLVFACGGHNGIEHLR
eukprot:GHVL01039586.1.p1 GENE.GHVL01039586.1~~GHVL01039586.1.p1  ORF type:complete len:320 (+),score=79.04 GHVL01039586.1:55-1014(+)